VTAVSFFSIVNIAVATGLVFARISRPTSREALVDNQVELIALLSGTDDTLSETIYARHSYKPDHIRWNHRFADVLSLDERGRRVVDLRRFHDTEPEIVISAP